MYVNQSEWMASRTALFYPILSRCESCQMEAGFELSALIYKAQLSPIGEKLRSSQAVRRKARQRSKVRITQPHTQFSHALAVMVGSPFLVRVTRLPI